jgi:hypothetical protein
VQRLRDDVAKRLEAMYESTRTRPREGAWLMVLPDVWKQRQTAHFHVYARNDLVAERVAEAAEFHLAGIARWLGVPAAQPGQPRWEVRVHAELSDLQRAADTPARARAASRTRSQGQRLLLRRLDLFQADPFLLSGTLPNEITHALLTDAYGDEGPPLAIVEGLALQAEPPARRLLLRRLLGQTAPDADALLATERLPDDDEMRFYAHADALTGLLLHRMGRRLTGGTADAESPRSSQPGVPGQAIAGALAALRGGHRPDWWEAFGWNDRHAMQSAWEAWHAARRNPPRMPLMILTGPSPEDPHNNR